MDKQDRQGARTVSQLEQKYGFGKSFAEVYGIATGARTTAEEAKETAENAKTKAENPDHKAIFNALTADGTLEGLYRKDGSLYINASYIKSGTFIGEAEVFLEPGEPELNVITAHNEGLVDIPPHLLPYYDFNGDGVVSWNDRELCRQAVVYGKPLPEEFTSKHLSTVRIEIDVRNPKKAISFSGTNIWGRAVDFSLGVENELLCGDGENQIYRYVDGEKETLNPHYEDAISIRTMEKFLGFPIYKTLDPRHQSRTLKYYFDPVTMQREYIDYDVDFIVDSGSTITGNGTWYYKKWYSGRVDADIRYYHKPTATGDQNVVFAAPCELVDSPIVTATLANNGNVATGVTASNSGGNISPNHNVIYLCLKGVNDTAWNVGINVHLSGQWK